MRKIFVVLIIVLGSTLSRAQSHWESIVRADQTWKYLPATSEPDAGWNMPGFNDGSWQEGPGGIGYSDGDDATVIDAVNSLYLRMNFAIGDTSIIESLLLDIDYDDAFVAYLNGVEIGRSPNLGDQDPVYNSPLTIDHEAVLKDGGIPDRYNVDRKLLVEGENLLAVQVINNSIGSSDLTSIIYLQGLIGGDDIIYAETPSWFSDPILLESSNLPLVFINTDGLSINNYDRITAQMGIINNGQGQRNFMDDPFTDYDGQISIKIRGQSSQMFPKKSYSFETQDSLGENNNVSLMGMPGENDWILYAPYSDKSMLRNSVTFELGSMTENYCSRMAFCEVYINDQYEGVYILMEKIKRDEDRVNISNLKPEDNLGDELTGGYIFKVDKIDGDYQEGYTGFLSVPNPTYPGASYITYQYYQPEADELTSVQKAYLNGYIQEAENMLISRYFNDRENGYNQYVNVSSFVDFMLINEISKEVDKYRFSSYFYKKKASKGGEIYAGPIWDFNLGYGNVDYWYEGLTTTNLMCTNVSGRIFWWKRLMEDSYFSDLTAKRWSSLRENEFSDAAITAVIDSITGLIDEAKERNFQRWPTLGTYVWPNHDWEGNTYEDEVDYFQTWLMARLAWMDGYLTGSSLNPSVAIEQFSVSSTKVRCILLLTDDFFTNKMLRTKYFDLVSPSEYLSVDSVYYVNSHTAYIDIVSENGYSVEGTQFYVEVDDNILNGFWDLESETVQVGNEEFSLPSATVMIYSAGNRICIRTESPESLPDRIQVVNSMGQVCRTFPLERSTFNEIQSGLSAGIYFIRLQSESNSITERVFLEGN